MLRIVFGLPKDRGAVSDLRGEFRRMVSPHPDSSAAGFLVSYADAYQAAGALVYRAAGDATPLRDCRPTFLAWWLLAEYWCPCCSPHRRTIGVWTLAMCGYLPAVFWSASSITVILRWSRPLIILLLALVPEAILQWIAGRRANRPEM